MNAIEIEGVTKTFRTTTAVDALDLAVPAGSLCGFLGPNGAGKSTTIRMIMSIIRPDAGRIGVLGGDALESKDRIGYLPEERGVYRKMKVGEFVEYVARLKGARRDDLRDHVRGWLERLELPDVYGKRCQELSKGMQQKVQFLAAVVHEPELLILDEPFSGLDPVSGALLNREIQALRGEGTTIIFSTHVLHQAEQICDRLFLIHHGVKLLDATLEEIRARFDPRTIGCEPLDPDVDLGAVPGVRDVHRAPGSPVAELALEDGVDAQAILRRLLELGPMRSVELRRPTLEEIFVQLVERGEGHAAAERAREELSRT